ncbi:MAG: hypothetical protein OI74_07785 [Gammaproteobacteria bacterium (ex Lamellibrachia satsuma)]|nr:MAG: tetratricopeptide repeat protein [Gammaproteobacteria bacterium (ex Lamellibrachia satsuma)]RRS33514.1 MAG: hypothetical protein OI74_07785 [Gammaproteobacteria bacterium (ex Lamellibrachia satsuma)]RRS34200.1 MAG: hypothetical protein NV67_13960 [Gammaproteobacteria bacterium (ex Lamellibrachia satsuma)]
MASNIANRHVRIFVSSTFQDLEKERELLTRETFPAIREKMAERQVTLSEVDLRWGITAEDAEQGRVLQLCLEEIDRCRPYFVGIVGNRYGSRIEPDTGTVAKYDWLRNAAGSSITELEFLYGALNSPDTAQRSIFYVRIDAEGAHSSMELRALVKKIEDAGLPLRRGWREPRELANLLAEDFLALLQKEFPDETLDQYELVASQHTYYAKNAAATYAANEDNLRRLHSFVESDEPPLAITGEAGCGKTALLAVFSGFLAKESTFVHFVGPLTNSTDPILLMRRLLNWLTRVIGVETNVDVGANDLKNVIDTALINIPKGKKITVIIDSVDLLNDVHEARRFVWLPRHPPPNVRLIISSQNQDVIDATARRGWEVHLLAPLDVKQREQIAQRYLKPHGKALSRSQLEVVSNSHQAGNLLFLQTALTELRLFGAFELLDAQLDRLLSFRDTEELLGKIIDRLDKEDQSGSVRCLLEMLWVSHSGMTENEIMSIAESEGRHAQLVWVATRRSLEAHLVEQADRIRISSHSLKNAVAKKYFSDADAAIKTRHLLVSYYGGLPCVRRIQELPAQLIALKQYEELYALLVDIGNFQAFPVEENSRPQLQFLWQFLPSFDPVAGYIESFEKFLGEKSPTLDEQISILNELGLFFGELSRHDGAASVYKRALSLATIVHGENGPETAVHINNVGHALLQNGDREAANTHFQMAIDLCQASAKPNYTLIASFIDNLAQTLTSPKDATEVFQRAYSLRKSVLGPHSPATLRSLHNLAQSTYKSGDIDAAEHMARKVIDLREDVLGWDNLYVAISRGLLAAILIERQNFEEMESQLMGAIQVYEKQRGYDHPSTLNLRNLFAVALLRQNRGREAEPLLRELIEHFRENGDLESPFAITVLHNLGVARKQQGYPNEALSIVEEAISLERVHADIDTPQELTFQNTLAGILVDLGQRDAAECKYREVLEKRQELIGEEHLDTSRTLHELGKLLLYIDPVEAVKCLERAVRIRSKKLGMEHNLTKESEEVLSKAQRIS